MFQPSPFGKHGDVEMGGQQLYPHMIENPEMRWGFIRKVYTILSIQMILTVIVAAIVVAVPSIPMFFLSSLAGRVTYLLLAFFPFIMICPLYYYHQKHPINLILLGLFTVGMSLLIGLSCAFTKGEIVLEAAFLTAVVTVSLTLYTFWAAKRGKDFSYLGPILFCAVMVLMVFGLIQMFIPLGKTSTMIYGALGAIIFSGYIIYDTDNLIRRFSYDEYIWASVSLYLDIINLFLALLTILRAADG